LRGDITDVKYLISIKSRVNVYLEEGCSAQLNMRHYTYTTGICHTVKITVVYGAERKAKRMVLQYINGVGSNPVEGRTQIGQL
jgi:hypothetical protein